MKSIFIFKVYSHPLESCDIFEGFNDFCRTFKLYRGKTKTEEENEIVGEFKGLFKVYPLSEDSEQIFSRRMTENLSHNDVQDCLIRVYIIRGIDLQAKDSNGQSDPYIEIQLGKLTYFVHALSNVLITNIFYLSNTYLKQLE